ncbi:MAG: hypothetical protein U0U67_11125 [Chitinophagales bacterium]
MRLHLESGFLDIDVPRDSIENLTIIHSDVIVNESNCSVKKFTELHKQGIINENSKNAFEKNVQFDTIIRINGKLFSIIASESFNANRKQYYKEISAMTEINGNWVSFVNKLTTKKNDSLNINFRRNAMQIFETIKIK